MSIKNGTLKVVWAYLVALSLFAIFLYPFMGLLKDFRKWLPIYSLAFFLLMALLIYLDMRKLARAEKRDAVGSISYPHKGLVYGAFAALPVILLEVLYFIIRFNDQVIERFKELIFKALIGPLFWVLKSGNYSIAAYVAIALVLPLLATIFYMSGYYNIPAAKVEKIEHNPAAFKKSPWNPSVKNKTQKNKSGKTKKPGGK